MIDIRGLFKRWPKFYYFIMVIFGPVLFTGLSPAEFLRRNPSSGKMLNIGSGPRRIAPGVTNVDMYPFDGVDVVADAASIPLPDGSISRIISDNVLERVKRSICRRL